MNKDRTSSTGSIRRQAELAPTTDPDISEAPRHIVASRIVRLPSSEFLTDLARRLTRPSQANRVFTPETLSFTLLMSARLTYQCAQYDGEAFRAWNDNRYGNHHTKESREQAIRDASDLADYARAEAAKDADRAYVLLTDTEASEMTVADVLDRISRLLVPGLGRRLFATGIKRGNERLVVKAVA
ncbi:hypothetical protein AB0L71_28150 [Streptomyces sp. NPDC052052]|uniref:hypothetical protein n=1 Tax=Streptomyces sp. NPDC052052 TaxID=3154756 RepID=UPI00343E3075